MTPNGVLTLAMSRPLGRFHLPICSPTGSFKFEISFKPIAIDSILSSFNVRRSRKALEILFSLAFSISI